MTTSCRACGAAADSCCINVQVFMTLGDVERIRAWSGRDGFAACEEFGPEYAHDRDDPGWPSLIAGPDGRRRVLKRRPDGKCFFLDAQGCALPAGVRPLLCRIYPYLFTAHGITGLDPGCPVFPKKNRQKLLDRAGMPLARAEEWRRQLYAEIQAEKQAAGTGKMLSLS